LNKKKNALSKTRLEDFAGWYQEVIDAAEMAESSGVRGCMIIRPWGFKIWERIQQHLDRKIQETGHDNCYFPIFIPLELIEKEAEHVEGFAKEMAVVTHHRLEMSAGRLVPAGPLESPLVVRPTSEAMFTEAFRRWIHSYRDLPIKLNQWANVVRWELRPRLFLRTSEFLWQEGHTAHASEKEALDEVKTMLDAYRSLAEEFMAIPVIPGTKSEGERFPGAVETHTIEAMMQDGRALQAGTSHFLGQNFAKSSGIEYLDAQGSLQVPYTTSWGVSTRVIGALIMVHGDDDGLRLPPRLAPYQVVIVPLERDPAQQETVHSACAELAKRLGEQSYAGETVRVYVDRKLDKPTTKRWGWIKKGVPLVLEVGPRDIENGQVTVFTRDDIEAGSTSIDSAVFVGSIAATLETIQKRMFDLANAYREKLTFDSVTSLEEMRAHFESGTGFIRAKWSGDLKSEALFKEFGVTPRCIPYQQSGTEGRCIVTGASEKTDAIFGKAY
jgi:prolyl-tRNA synthetase